MKKKISIDFALFLYTKMSDKHNFSKSRLHKWFLYEGPSETDKAERIRFNATVFIF